MTQETKTLALSDGRILSWCEYGSPTSDLPPIFSFHGWPGSRLEGAVWQESAIAKGLRIISPDRPGMGLSTPQPDRTLSSYPPDLLELADHLGIQQFKVLGVSGGGPYVFACLNSIPKERCLGGQVVSSIYPLALGTKGMGWINRISLFVAGWSPSLFGKLLDWEMGKSARNTNPQELKKVAAKSMKSSPGPDQKAFARKDFGPFILESNREAFKQGSTGPGHEGHLYASPWPFKLADIDASNLCIWHGRLDTNCPIGMAEKAAGLLTGARTEWIEGEAHCVVAQHREAILQNFLS
jgi:pimeloyl-ACP methyl ester carboxylesterase